MTGQTGTARIPVEKVFPDRSNVRAELGDVTELARSLSAVGMLQPIVVRPRGAGTWTIVDGHRRYQAALLADLKTVPCIAIRPHGEPEKTALMLAAAMHEQLKPLEQARAFAALRDDAHMSTTTIALRTGYTTATVRNRLALLDLPGDAQDMVIAGELTVTDAQNLARQVARTGSGTARVAAPRARHFTKHHPLGEFVASVCTHKDARQLVGGVGCGECWERAIRDDERFKQLGGAQ